MECPEQEKQEQPGQQDGALSKTLENLNSVAADIINMSDEGTTVAAPPSTDSTQRTLIHAHTHVHVHQTQPKARQLENNLPELLKAEGSSLPASAASGEKQSCPLQVQSIMNDQQHGQQNKPDEPATGAAATSKQSSLPGATEVVAEAGAGAAAGPMMDDRQTVDFIEGDSPTSAANCQLNAGTNHKAQEEQRLMKTSQHTSNQVTTAAAAAGTETETAKAVTSAE